MVGMLCVFCAPSMLAGLAEAQQQVGRVRIHDSIGAQLIDSDSVA